MVEHGKKLFGFGFGGCYGVVMNDSELLNAYATRGDERAFTELVRRHLDLVYSAAVRQVGGDHHLAADVAQSVFCDLARKAKELSGRPVLGPWLYTSTRMAAAKVVRGEQRRSERERKAFLMQEELSEPSPEEGNWQQLSGVLDEAMHELKEGEREAIVLRFLEKRPFAEVGEMLGVSPDGARMRVERALERLRGVLGSRGMNVSTLAVGTLLMEQAVTAAPVGLLATVTASALAGATTVAATETGLGFLKFMGMTKMQAGAVGLLIVGAAVPLSMQYNANQELKAANTALARNEEELAAQIPQLEAENKRLASLVAQRAQTANNSNEIYRLRAEVTRLREEAAAGRTRKTAGGANDPMQETLQTLGTRVLNLKQRLAELPHTQIPELQYLKETDWLEAVANMPRLESEEEYRQALNSLRAQAKGEVGRRIQQAVKKFAEANRGMLPESLAQVVGHIEKPIDPAILDRYQMTSRGALSDLRQGAVVFEEVAPPVDDEHDTLVRFHRDGQSTTSYSRIGTMLEMAAEAYANANGGSLPRNSGELTPYLQEAVEPGRVEKFLGKIPPNVKTLAEMKAQR